MTHSAAPSLTALPQIGERAPLRIWHLLENYPPQYGGGVTLTTRDICRVQAAAGNSVRVLCVTASEEKPYQISTDYDGKIQIDRLSLPYFASAHDPEGMWLGLPRWKEHERRVCELLDELLVDWQPDVVDYHVIRALGEACLLHLAKRGIPIVATLHDSWLICPRMMLLQSPTARPCTGPGPVKCLACLYSEYEAKPHTASLKLPWRIIRRGGMPAYRLLRRWQTRSCIEASIARSRYLAEVHRPHLPGLVTHLPLGIDLTGRPEHWVERPRHPLRFGFLGGAQRHKGLDQLLQACAELQSAGHAFELHVWGPNLDASSLSLGRLRLTDRVQLHGSFQAEERWSVYEQVDVAIMATTTCEALGRVVQEAAAAGVVTIGPDAGGISEQIRHGVDGLLYQFRDPADLASKMALLIQDPALLVRLQQNLRIPPDSRAVGAQVEEFYRQVLADQQNRPSAV